MPHHILKLNYCFQSRNHVSCFETQIISNLPVFEEQQENDSFWVNILESAEINQLDNIDIQAILNEFDIDETQGS